MRINQSFYVFVHELLVEFRTKRIVDELRGLLVGFGPGTVFEHHVVIPSSFDSQIGLRGFAGVVQQRVAAENVFGANAFFFLTLFNFLENDEQDRVDE